MTITGLPAHVDLLFWLSRPAVRRPRVELRGRRKKLTA
jgi:hypothetical protein